MSTSNSGGAFYLPPFWMPIVTTPGIGVLQQQVSRMLAPLLKPFRTHDRVGNGSIVDVHTALARALQLTEKGYWHWVTIDYLPIADRLQPNDLAAPLWCGHVTKGFHKLVEFLIVMGDEYQLPRRGALHRTLVDLLLGERTDFLICREATDPSVVMRVGTEVAAVCRTPSSLRSTLEELAQTMDRGNAMESGVDLAAVADIGAGESAVWLGYRISGGEELRIEIADSAWAALTGMVDYARNHLNHLAKVDMRRVLKDWCSWVGPTFDHVDVDAACDRIISTLSFGKFVQPARDWLLGVWQSAYQNWRVQRDSLRDR